MSSSLSLGDGCSAETDVASETAALDRVDIFGRPCSDDRSCGGLGHCLDGLCACRGDLTACRESCIDLGSDASNCGTCGHRCARGVPCVSGACGDDVTALGSFLAPVQVSGDNPMGTCDQANEGAPEISASAGDVFLFAGHHGNTTYNWATADNVNWGAGGLMPVPSGYTYAFDPGATTHGGTGLNYLSIMADDAALVRRIVIAGATPSNMDNGLFAFSSVIGTSSQTDGPVMYFDPNTWNLWVSDRWLNGGRFRLHLFSPCVSGAPGSPTCPLKAGFPITVQSGIAGHPNVIVNPCTQNAVAGYFAEQIGGLNRIRIRFYNTSGTRVGQDLILASAGLYQNGTCVGGGSCTISGGHICKCGGASTTSCGGSGCHTLWHRVHMSVRYVGSNDCRLAVGFENALTAGDGQRYYKGWYYILNIANENLVTILGGGESSPSSFARNEWGATVSLNQFTAGFGFFYYQHQNSLPCTTVFRGVTNTNYGVGSTTPIGPFTDPFPTMRFANVSGLGHYIEIVRRGLPNGHLFPTWAEPVVTSAVCPATCLGSARSDRVMGVRVTP